MSAQRDLIQAAQHLLTLAANLQADPRIAPYLGKPKPAAKRQPRSDRGVPRGPRKVTKKITSKRRKAVSPEEVIA